MKDINGISDDKLNITLLGLDKYLFLINDSNQELNQHFNPNYKNNFNSQNFLENYNFKKKCFQKDFKYYFFIVPDKSIVCKEFLPFKHDTINRNINILKDTIDFADYLNEKDYFKYDSHINYYGGRKLSFKFLNHIDNNFSLDKYNDLIDKADTIEKKRFFDLLFEKNWSYSEKLRDEFPLSKTYKLPRPKGLELIDDFPEVFKWCGIRKSIYYKNKNSYSNLRVLIFGDSTFEMLEPYLSLYFKELFFYWDHGLYNVDLIRWFQPDLIFEIRIERFIDTLPFPDWILNKKEMDFSRKYLMNKLLDNNFQLKKRLKKINDDNKKLKKENKTYKLSNSQKDKQINKILNSKSWKITKVLRKIKNLK